MDTSQLLSGAIRTKNISQILVERVTDGILSGSLRPGDKLPTEEEFAKRVGVSRNSVREAVKILEAFGLVEIRRADGTYIADQFRGEIIQPLICGMALSTHNHKDVAEFKVRIQELIAKKIIDSGREDKLREFRNKTYAYRIASVEAVSEQQRFLDELEDDLSNMVDNPLLRDLYRMTVKIGRGVQTRAVERKFETGNAFWFTEFFREIADALLCGDERRVKRLIREEYLALLQGCTSSLSTK